MSQFRTDIQALRGLAVMLVVLDHIGFGALKSGFLGVDIFFVISGYLITGIIAKKILDGNFSLRDFYYRRARRLIPGAYATILFTCVGAYFFLNVLELRNLLYQVVGAVSYTTNIVLLSQAGYFDAAASTKPLLHLWSLAVEEQYYLVFPLLLILSPSRYWLPIVAALLVASLTACLYLNQSNPSASFYLLPTRAWELLIGSAGYLAAQKINVKVPRLLFFTALLALIVVPMQARQWAHPGSAALITCVATLIVLLAKSVIFNRSPLVKPLVVLGDISYSLYLVHWPIIVFFQNTNPGSTSLIFKVTLLFSSLAAAVALYFLVERPSRSIKIPPMKLSGGVALGAVILLVSQYIVLSFHKAEMDFEFIRRPNYGLDKSCDINIFKNTEKCRTSEFADTMVWGDSYAMHSVGGIKNHRRNGIVQATYSACPPFLNTAPYNPLRPDAESMANYCIAFNDGVLNAIKTSQYIKTVILAASFWQYTVPNNSMQVRLAGTQATTTVVPTSLSLAEADLGNTIETLQNLGKEVIVIGPPPLVGDDNIVCMERRLSGKMLLPDKSFCGISLDTYRRTDAGVIELLDVIEKKYKVKVVRLSSALCDKKVCRTIVDDVPMYRDSGHLSYEGSAKVFDDLANANRLW